MYLNGNVIATGNINANAVTQTASAIGGTATGSYGGWTNAVQLTIYSSGNPLYIATNGGDINGSYNQGDADYITYPYYQLVRDGYAVLIGYNKSASMSYSETLGPGWYTYYLQITSTYAGSAYVSNPSIFIIETKR
jgi:hypothetical protein